MPNAGASETILLDIDHYPHYLVALFRLAKFGKADVYGNWARPGQVNAACQFTIDEVLASKWPDLKDVERITLLFDSKAGPG